MNLSRSITHVFFAIQACSRKSQGVSYRKVHKPAGLYFQRLVWVGCPRFLINQNSLIMLQLPSELQLHFCMWDNGWCYHGLISPGSLNKSCVHNLVSEEICLCHCNLQDRLSTPVPWMPLPKMDKNVTPIIGVSLLQVSLKTKYKRKRNALTTSYMSQELLPGCLWHKASRKLGNNRSRLIQSGSDYLEIYSLSTGLFNAITEITEKVNTCLRNVFKCF